jgi:hypothetical protein
VSFEILRQVQGPRYARVEDGSHVVGYRPEQFQPLFIVPQKLFGKAKFLM